MKTVWSDLLKDNGWSEDFNTVLDNSRDAHQTVVALEQWLWDYVVAKDVVPVKMAEPLASLIKQLHQHLETIETKANIIQSQITSGPISKWVSGRRLNREEYYLLTAFGVPLITPQSMGIITRNEFEFFDMFCYEDDHVCCFINPDPADTGEKRSVGRYPEELDIKGLRPDQHDFFKVNFPEIYARFNR